ncbi:hypothetical protein OHA72_64155 [Dactylosporangium sp. NBC_01737]|uniref:carbohydrate-binding protein n=1 Tax=Dactylosporangium sp. NBC_01737 TaxID=2975959 RepID=UPI002E0F20BB|nr:hypothetical protein OHA72_64155 [Dactylosporangium sp. NBC_01737]
MGRTDRTLLWGTAALIAFTLGAVAVARTNGGAVVGADDSRLCYNSAGVGAACLPPPPAGFEDVAIPAGAAPAKPPPPPSPVTSEPAPKATTPPPTTRKPTTKKWAVGVAYGEGAQVTYQGRVYACLQPHTSQVDWSPVAAPALWSRVS